MSLFIQLRHIFERCGKYLRELDLSHFVVPKNFNFYSLLLPNLQHINLDKSLTTIAKFKEICECNQTKLTSLAIKIGDRNNTATLLNPFLSKLSGLEYLSWDGRFDDNDIPLPS